MEKEERKRKIIWLGRNSRKHTTIEVWNTIKQLKNRIAPGIDNLKSEISFNFGTNTLLLFNRAIEVGSFPMCLKTSIVTIYKGGCRDEVVNYRPTSIFHNKA